MKTVFNRIQHYFQHTLWQDWAEDASSLKRSIGNTLRVSYIVLREIATGDLNLRAMSLVFTTLLSLVPLIAVAFSVLKAFGVHNQIEPFLLGMLEPLGPRGPDIASNIIGFVSNVKVGVLGTVGIAMLFYTIIALVQKVEAAFNFVWHVKRPRTLARRFTDYLSVVMIGPVLVFSALSLAATLLNHQVVQHMQSVEPFGTLLLMVSKLLPYLMITLAFTFLYKFIPNTRVKLWPAMIGAAVAGALWISIGTLFASFVASSSNYTAIYSSFAILFFFMIWLYLAWFILLTGSQVAFYLQHPNLVKLGGRAFVLSPRLREKEGLWLMTVIARRFCEKQQPLDVEALEKMTGLSNEVVQELLTMLEQGGLLIEVAGEAVSYVPAKDIGSIQLSQILHCLRHAEERNLMVIKSQADPSVEAVLRDVNIKQNELLNGISLRDFALGKYPHE
jgi:membrane protein